MCQNLILFYQITRAWYSLKPGVRIITQAERLFKTVKVYSDRVMKKKLSLRKMKMMGAHISLI